MPFFAFVKIKISTLALHGNVKYFTFVINFVQFTCIFEGNLHNFV